MQTRSLIRLFFTVLVTLLALSPAGCVKGTPLAAKAADRKDVAGSFDLYLYGCRYPSDVETAAFLVDPAKTGAFDLYVLPTSYKITKGLSAEAAFEQADRFLNCGVRTVEKTVVQSIPDGAGGTIGYEVLPHYSPMEDVGQRPLIVNYSLREGKVTVFLRLDPEVERRIRGFSPTGAGAQ